MSVVDPVKVEFLKKMHEDILAHVRRRYATFAIKILTISALLGIGGAGAGLSKNLVTSLSGPSLTSSSLAAKSVSAEVYLLVPLIAILWDILFLEQNFAVLRITAFIRKRTDLAIEGDWEKYVFTLFSNDHCKSNEKKPWYVRFGGCVGKCFRRFYLGMILTTAASMVFSFFKAYYLLKPCPDQCPPLWFCAYVILLVLLGVTILCWDSWRQDVLNR